RPTENLVVPFASRVSAEEVGPTADQHDADETGLPDLHLLGLGAERVTELLVLLTLVIQLGMQHRNLVAEPLVLAVEIPEPCAQQSFTHPARSITEYPVHRHPPFLPRPVVTPPRSVHASGPSVSPPVRSLSGGRSRPRNGGFGVERVDGECASDHRLCDVADGDTTRGDP